MELRTLRYFVAVAEELHFGHAATRLRMSQPPLSRAIKHLETDVGAMLLQRSPTGVTLTPAGVAMLDEARALLAQADRLRARVAAAAGKATLTIGILGDSHDPAVPRLAETFRRDHPNVEIRIRETDLTDPTCGLRTGQVDVALTRGPFDESGLSVRELRTDQVGAVLRADDPLAGREHLVLADLADREWFQFPEGADPAWRTYWNGGRPRSGPIVRAVQECLQAVLWNGTVGMTTLDHRVPARLTVVPILDMPPSRVVVAWTERREANPLTRAFVQAAVAAYHHDSGL